MHSAILAFALQAVASSLDGEWVRTDGSVVVEILACGNASCGTIKFASDNARADARRGGTEHLIGTEVLTNLVPVSNDRWRGILFVPDRNLRTKVELRQLDADRLQIKACAIGKMLCKSQEWQRKTHRSP